MELSLMEKKMIEDKVSELLNEIGYRPDRDTYVDVVGFVRKHGFVVGNALLDDEEDGFLAIWQSAERNHKPGTAEYQKVIGVNVERELGWKRFIIAHEFAHSILHYQEGRIYLHREHTQGKNADENSVGIGLAMACSIIRQQKGDITVVSQEGSGTQFTIRFYC